MSMKCFILVAMILVSSAAEASSGGGPAQPLGRAEPRPLPVNVSLVTGHLP